MAANKVQILRPNRSYFNEVSRSTRGRDITRLQAFIEDLIPPQDRVLMYQSGGDLELYERVLEDDQVKTAMQQRVSALISREWEVLPGDESRKARKAADFLREVISNLDWDTICDKALYGIFYGFTVGECLYSTDGDYIVLDPDRGGIRIRNRRRFGFDWNLNPKLLTWENKLTGEPLPENKFWYFCFGADNHDDPYGRGLASWLYWPTLAKRTGMQKWLIALEKFAVPTTVGKYPAGATEAEKAALLEITQAVADETGLILPEGMLLDFLESSRTGTADYSTLYDKMNDAITKVILSQTMTTDNGSSLSQAQVHYAVRQDVVRADADLLHGSFNSQVVRWLLDLNYAHFEGAPYPTLWRRIDNEPDLTAQVERDRQLFDMGFRPKLEYVTDTYGDNFIDTQSVDKDADEPPPPLYQSLDVGELAELLRFVENAKGPLEKRIAVLQNVFAIPREQAIAMLPPDGDDSIMVPAPEPQQPSPATPAAEDGDEPEDPNPEDGAAAEADPPEADDSSQSEIALSVGEDTVLAFAGQLQQLAAPEFERWFEVIRGWLESSNDLEEFREKLTRGYPQLDSDRLTQIMTEAMFSGRLAGFYEAQEGD